MPRGRSGERLATMTFATPSARRALLTLCGVETWERFSFYGMQGILLLYLYASARHGGLGLSPGAAAGIVGAYASAVYLSTIGGAWVADRLLGPERTVLASAVLIMCGHLALAVVPGAGGVALGLGAVAIGSGALKTNTTNLIGALFARDTAARESGFALFYLGINVGSLAGPLLTGLVQVTWGFKAAFALAALGMGCGLAQYAMRRRAFASRFRAAPNPLPRTSRLRAAGVAVAGAGLLVAATAGGLITVHNLNELVLGVVVAAVLVLFASLLRSPRVSAEERGRVRAFIPMFAASTAFWALSQQQFTVLTVYADKQLNRSLFGWDMPVAWIQSINPIFIVALSGAFAALWARLGSRQPSSARKFALSNLIMGVAFLAFVPLAGAAANSVPLLPVVGILLLFSVAELLVAPVGLSFATAIAPAAYRSRLVALVYLSIALGTSLSGVLAGAYSIAGQVPYFVAMGAGSIVVAGAMFALAPWVTARTRMAVSASAVHLRPGTDADHDALWAIFREVIESGETYAMPPGTSREAALEYWTRNEGPWFVAELDGRVVGACMIHPNQPGLGAHVANAAYVVDARVRGHHVGRRLVQHSLEAARDEGYRAMQFNLVVETNAGARHLYEDLGFRVIGRVPQAFHWRDERYVDAFIFHRSVTG
jgi:POT family proton-dependent oligopeptide transporter